MLLNLAPATFRGIASEGMLLAAEDGQMVSLLQPDRKVEDGGPVH